MKYNENYTVAENKILSDLENVMKGVNTTVYNDYGDFQKLSMTKTIFSDHNDFDIDTVLEITYVNDGKILLLINGSPIKLTPVITQKCQQLLYEYKLKLSGETIVPQPNYQDIIKTEQQRDVYKMCAGARPQNIVLNKMPKKFNVVLLPKNPELYVVCCWGNRYSYVVNIPGSKIKSMIARKMFNKGRDFIEQQPYKLSDDRWHIRLNGKDFSFATEFGAMKFYNMIKGDTYYRLNSDDSRIWCKCLENNKRRHR